MGTFNVRCDGLPEQCITADSRKQAVERYLEKTGMPDWYFRKHGIVKRPWQKGEEYKR